MPENSLVAAGGEPDIAAAIRLVCDAVTSPVTRRLYGAALLDYFRWWKSHGCPPFTRASVQAYRTDLTGRGLSASSVNQRLAAVRKLAREAAANGLLASETSSGITQVTGARMSGSRTGNWLTREQTEMLINAPSSTTLKGRRDRAILALLIGCGLRRSEAVALTMEHVQQREGRWVIVDLRGKHGRIRSIPVPSWTKMLLDQWTAAARITSGRLLRALNRHGQLNGPSLSPQAVHDIVALYGRKIGLAVRPHDLRRTCAKLCRRAGGELEQIQALLGHDSLITTQKYLGAGQDLANAPNDCVGIRVR